MKLLMIQALGYFISYSGACKANRNLMEGLTKLGHECQVITITPNDNGLRDNELFQSKLASGEVIQVQAGGVSDIYHSNGVEIHALSDLQKLSSYVHLQVSKFEPDWVLVTEDRVSEVLEVALDAAPGRVVEIAHSQVALPFGPECYEENHKHKELLRRTSGIVASSTYLKEYLSKWGPFEAIMFPFPVHGFGPFNHYRNYGHGYITMINPSEIKGISIFIELARHFPHLKFASVPTWATTETNLELLRSLPNMAILDRVDDIDDILKQTEVLIVPSLWGEAFGAIIVDGLLRGIPVIASDVGGTAEAKLGTDYLIPVNPILYYDSKRDERLIPIPIVPEQDMEPWFAALNRLTTDRDHYEEMSEQSKMHSEEYIRRMDLQVLLNYLLSLNKASSPA